MNLRYNIHEIKSLVQQLERESQYIKRTDPGSAAKMSIAAEVIKQILFEPFSHVSEDPPFRVGDKDYTGYLVISDDKYKIADYICEDKNGVAERYPRFHVDGEYEPDVRYWMCLPKIPKDSKKFDAHKTVVGMRLDAGSFD